MALGIIEPKTNQRPPGTELLFDTAVADPEHHHEHSRLQHSEGKKGDIILVPQPSNDPNDPLLWPRWKREASFAFLFFNCIIFAACPGPMIAPATVALAVELDVPIKKVAQLSGYQLLIVGALGPFVSIFAQKYGKRPQFLFASIFGVIGTGICIAGFDQKNLAKSYNVLLTGRMIQGIGTTAYESLSVAAIGDMFFLHQRGLRTALLVLTLACLSSFVAIIAGTGFQNLGARNLFVILLPIQIFGTLGTFFFLPESQFVRNETSMPAASSEEIEAKNGDHTVAKQDSIDRTTTNTSTIPKRSFVQDLRPYSGVIYNSDGTFKLLGEIFVHLLNPAVIWIQIVSAVLVSFFVGTAYTLAQIFTPPPYSLNVAQNGFFFTGALVGGILGISAGPICDFTARFLSRRNKGIYEPEFRIPVCLLAVVVFAIGWFTFGWALDHPAKGRVVLCSFCYGAICFGTSVASTSGGLYILDSFKSYSTEIFILQMMIKNFLFYAFSTFINEFAAKEGPGHMCRVFGIVTVCGFVSCIPMYMFGKVNRVWVHKLWSKYLHTKL
ncbi:MFS general substrate transporter [Aaosphaeria arxii CBS 175.79]|uniref:MFS general substrate transporter n=1 Tax=Aaosphaeria arxii CBS 175.79 TaxID=1450172 RepID=A0A6A5XU02_9PLEO|nr:MFS general substrate transporter [Aaosphaeria arxii CBS 175.79]KAF2016396.1 MFS general substrate transporter [Aaosphaeria arxii CBS 175.79]